MFKQWHIFKSFLSYCWIVILLPIGSERCSYAQQKSCSKIDRIIKLNSWSWALLEKPPGMQPLKNFPAFYGTRRFITVFTRALHRSLSWAISIKSIPPHPISLRSNLLLSTNLRLSPPSGLFPSGFPTDTLYAFLFRPYLCYIPCPSHSPWLVYSNYTWQILNIMKFLIT
jgi:hypothetical protein